MVHSADKRDRVGIICHTTCRSVILDVYILETLPRNGVVESWETEKAKRFAKIVITSWYPE